MKFWHMVWFHIKRILKTPSLIGNIILVPIIMVLVFSFFSRNEINNQQNGSPPSVATVLLIGEGNEELIAMLNKYEYEANIWTDRTKAFEDLETGEVGVVYELPANYIERLSAGEQLSIQVFNRSEQVRSTTFEYDIRNITQELLLKHRIAEKTQQPVEITYTDNVEIIQSGQQDVEMNIGISVIFGMISYVFVSGLSVSVDLVSFKKQLALRRSVVTPNSKYTVLASHLLAHVLIILSTNLILLMYLQSILQFEWEIVIRSGVALCLAVLLAISYCLVLFRLLKEPNYVSNVGIVVLMIWTGLGMTERFNIESPIQMLAYISPFKWLNNMIFDGLTVSGITILILMAGVLFTAGGYRLEQFTNK